jgi:hypothetical protein
MILKMIEPGRCCACLPYEYVLSSQARLAHVRPHQNLLGEIEPFATVHSVKLQYQVGGMKDWRE